MNKRWEVAIVILCALVFIGVGLNLTLSQPVDAGQQIRFNGQVLDVGGASNVQVQSSSSVQTFAADEQGGAVTVTTNIVTVTVWSKP